MRTSTTTPAAPAASATMLHGLRRLRKKAGISQTRAAAAVGVSRQSYCSWETLRAIPTAGNLIALMELFNCSFEDLFRDKVREE